MEKQTSKPKWTSAPVEKLQDCTRRLAAVAMGREKADTVIRGVRLVNVNTGEILPDTDIAIAAGRIALVGDASHTIGDATAVIDGAGRYAAPGFLDGHIHVESSMMTVREYARTVIPHGTTSIFPDPHEIANVLGEHGLEFMIADAEGIPLRVFTQMPSCVPAVPGFEETGAVLGPQETARFMAGDSIYGLGEMMNFPGVLGGDADTHSKIASTLAAGKTVTGHYSMPETGMGLNAYIASGVRCCHESVRAEDALAKMRLGMYAQIREGSAWHDLHEVIRSITERKIDSRFACLISDDTHPHTLIAHGHMDHIVRRAIQEGVDPITAIQMVTINAAQCFQMDKDLGSIAPGKIADILLISDLTSVQVETVFIGGAIVVEEGEMRVEIPASQCPDSIRNTIHVPHPFTAEDFAIPAPQNAGSAVTARVIQVLEAKVGTLAKTHSLPVVDGHVCADAAAGINKLAVVERHKNTGETGRGFVSGFGLRQGAVASTVAHDAHNLMIVGASEADMAVAANALTECGGGMVAVRDGEVIALLPLPIAGLMSEEPVQSINEKVQALDAAWKILGCDMVSPFMTMALVSLAVLPELRLTNKGLIDTTTYSFTGLFVE
ncbi:adenine deaminase [Ruminococcaceae bacterium OttesenSCG-928-L11]|nr:adenine deaminase [Ruminococcaceae bacterium OttesenSCG-928-L11]